MLCGSTFIAHGSEGTETNSIPGLPRFSQYGGSYGGRRTVELSFHDIVANDGLEIITKILRFFPMATSSSMNEKLAPIMATLISRRNPER